MIITGSPETKPLIFFDFIENQDISTSRHTRVRTGSRPVISGMLRSSTGRVAMFEISMVMASSEG